MFIQQGATIYKSTIIKYSLIFVLLGLAFGKSGKYTAKNNKEMVFPQRASKFYSNLINRNNREFYDGYFLRAGEFLIDTAKVYSEDDRGQTWPSISKGNNFYVIVYWDDPFTAAGENIEAVRVTPSGVLIDSGGILVSEDIEFHSGYTSLRICFGGDKFLVVWDWQEGGEYNIFGKRIDENGVVIDSTRLPVSISSGNQISPAISFDGTNYFVVWHDSRNAATGVDIYGARVDTSGAVIDTNGILIYERDGNQIKASIAYDGTNYLVVWEDGGDIKGARLTPQGVVLDTMHIAMTSDIEENARVYFGNGMYLLVWQRKPGTYEPADIYGARITPDGTVLDPDGFPISTASNSQSSPDLFFDGENFLVCWSDERAQQYYPDLYGARVDTSGNVLDPGGIPISTRNYNSAHHVTVSLSDTTYFVVWDYFNVGYARDIFASRVTTSGNVLDPEGIDLSYKCNTQTQPSISYDTSNYLVIWGDFRKNTQWDIYGMRVDTTGSLLDTVSFPICSYNNYQLGPSVCFNGTNYLATWMDFRSSLYYIYGARITQEGTVIDPNGFFIASNYKDLWYPSVAFGTENHLIVYDNSDDIFPQPPYYGEIYGTVVDTSANIIDHLQISFGSYNEFSADVAFDNTNFFVVWQRSDGSQFDIYGARVTEQGVLLDPGGILISSRAGHEGFPKVSFDGQNYLVVWTGEDGQSWNVYGARVSPEGVVLDPNGFVISDGTFDEYLPDLGFFGDSTYYLVFWQDWRNGDADIYAAKVNTGGFVDTSFLFSQQPRDQWHLSVPHVVQGNKTLIVWDCYAPTPYGTDRIWGKFYDETGVEEIEKIHYIRIVKCIYPNPFTSQIALSLTTPAKTNYKLKIYDIVGRLLTLCILEPETRTFHWDLKNLSSGIYFLKIEANDRDEFYKLIKTK
jgi:hypothetical protein